MESSDAPVAEAEWSVIKTDAPFGEASDECVIDNVLDRCTEEIENHLRRVENDVHAATDGAARSVDDDCASMKTAIDKEAEREIEKIRARRDERLNENREKAAERHQTIANRRKELLKQIQDLGDDIRANMERLKTRHYGSPMAKVHTNLDQLLAKYQKNGETEGPQTKKSLASGLLCIAEQVSAIASNVAFVSIKGTCIGRVEGAKNWWALEREIDVTPIEVPVLKGSISENEVVIEDGKTSHVYVTNIASGTTKLSIEDKLQLFNCSSQNNTGAIVCGTRDGRVLLYDRSWKLLNRVTLPEKFHNSDEVVCVAVDHQGTMFFAKYGSHYIHVYHTTGTRWLRTIDVGEMVPIRGIHILPTGIVVHSAMYGEQACVLNLDGTQKTTVFLEESENKCLSILSTNRWTDAIYNLSFDSASGCCVVEELGDLSAEDGGVKKVVEFPAPGMANGLTGAQGLILLESDRMVTCDGTRVLVFAKKQGVDQLPQIVSGQSCYQSTVL